MKHEGLHRNRLHPDAGNPLEIIYANMWERDNSNRAGIRTPLLCNLLGDGSHAAESSQRDATVAATIIQWLGSPVGRSFIDEGRKLLTAREAARACRICGQE